MLSPRLLQLPLHYGLRTANTKSFNTSGETVIFQECPLVGPLLELYPTQIGNLLIHDVLYFLHDFAEKPFFFELLIPLFFMVIGITQPLT